MSQKTAKAPVSRKPEREIAIELDSKVYKYSGVKLTIAENSLNLVIGKSGVGKSTLLREYLHQYFESYEHISQKPLLGNKNSYVATALDIFRRMLSIFADKHGKSKRFFFNYAGGEGACPKCGGAGFIEYGDESKIRLVCKECSVTYS